MNSNSSKKSNQVMEIQKSIEDDGFAILKNFFSAEEIDSLETCVTELYLLQAQKIGEYRDQCLKLQKKDRSNFEKISTIHEIMEGNDKEALYQVQRFLTSSPVARNIFNQALLKLSGTLLDSDPNRILVDGPGLFINRPNTERLLSKWHSEAHYYPKRRRFLNIWFPLFNNKTKNNGTMSFKTKSHVNDLPFSDYQGYNKNTQDSANFLVQHQIPNNFLESYDEYWCENNHGDLVIFDKNLAHRSNQNNSDKYSFAVVARIWDPTDDLTLSGSLIATPYGGNVGRPNLKVNPFL